jgi:hypothetical protein
MEAQWHIRKQISESQTFFLFVNLMAMSGRRSPCPQQGLGCGQFPVGISPTGIVYAPSKSWVYVVNEGSNTVSVLPNGCPNYLPKLAHEKSG